MCSTNNNNNKIDHKINKILITNRGEIAVRIMKTCKNLGIRTVAVYSDADLNAPFVSMADEAFSLNAITPRDSYLNIDKIVDIAIKSKADAIHPGYGFLSENSTFVATLKSKNIKFIGPSSSSIKAMGDKITAKALALKNDVNVVPGFIGVIDNNDQIHDIVSKIGLPIMIKAVAGGGGKGMKVVYNNKDIDGAITSARNEARNSFNDDRIFIEKYIKNPRHIEIQIASDMYGNIVCLGDRECSIQRFNQKIIEESPSPFLDDATRNCMYDQSLKLAKACEYYSVGTIEFIVGQDKKFYFLEMNTRLQVEHTVTEYVTGLDLVEIMIRIAEGEKLPFTQKDVKNNGWAIESRICAEDPAKNFLPSIGRITHYIEPTKRYSVRVDSGINQGSEVSPFYDSMLAKLITYGDSRKEAISEMKRALSEFSIGGIFTNISLLEAIMRNERFISGDISTNFIEEVYSKGFKGTEINNEVVRAFIMTSIVIYLSNNKKLYYKDTNVIVDTNHDSDAKKVVVTIGSKNEYEIKIVNESNNLLTIASENKNIVFEHDYAPGHKIIRGKINEEQVAVKICHLDGSYILSYGGVTERVATYAGHIAHLLKYMSFDISNSITDKLISPITGIIIKINVENGMNVIDGQELVIIEAMKMENVIRAEFDTTIGTICKREGDLVSSGEVLINYQKKTITL